MRGKRDISVCRLRIGTHDLGLHIRQSCKRHRKTPGTNRTTLASALFLNPAIGVPLKESDARLCWARKERLPKRLRETTVSFLSAFRHQGFKQTSLARMKKEGDHVKLILTRLNLCLEDEVVMVNASVNIMPIAAAKLRSPLVGDP